MHSERHQYSNTVTVFVKYQFLILLGYVLHHSTPASINTLHVSSGQFLSLNNCSKDKLLEIPDSNTITDLNVNHCYIPTLENAFFMRFTSLAILEITDSHLTILEDYAFHGLKHLRSLSLAHNNLTCVKSWANEQMSSLISLDLKYNAIRELTLKSFSRYPSLQRLNLLGNQLEDIDDGIFRWMPQLKYLNLGRNRLAVLESRNFHAMHRLSYLALHFNAIARIENDSFNTNTHLRTLRLEGNKLKNLEFLKVKSLTRLQHLNLSFNALETLDERIFSKDFEIVDLDLSHNCIKEMKGDVFLGLESLLNLNISHNFLHSIAPQTFDELFSLERLDLKHNELEDFPARLLNFTKRLHHIDLSHNKLSALEAEVFSSLSYLNMLDLSQNQLSSDHFITNIAHDLLYNKLHLNLSDNHYRSLNISSLIGFEQVELAGNWWSCKWLINEMLKVPKYINFGRPYAVQTDWSLNILDTNGINCYDEDARRNIIILDTSRIGEQKIADVLCSQPSSVETQPSPPPLNWPRIKSDRFDSRSVVLWMLFAIALAFSALRIGRKLIDQKESNRKATLMRDMQSRHSEKDKLTKEYDASDINNLRNFCDKAGVVK